MSTPKPTADQPMLERIEAQVGNIGGGFTIRRALPSRERHMVGAWCFLDHLGPADYAAGQGLHVGPHPHIGLQTFTWVIEGEILHLDSLGYEQVIRPGQVNLMTAGRGIAHAEDSVNAEAGRVHAAQLWIALPESERQRAPAFQHYPALPVLRADGFTITVLAGTAFGQTAPTQVYSPLLGLDLASAGAAETLVPLNPAFEHAVLVLSGEATAAGERLAPGTLLYLGRGRAQLSLRCEATTRLLLVGGEPFAEAILLWWNFVGRSQEEVVAAARQWNAGEHFGEVKGTTLKRLAAPDPAGLHLKATRD